MDKVILYPERDAAELCDYYMRHVDHMTSEELFGKGDIAVQLAWRDREIDQLRQQLAATIAERDRAVKDAERYRWLRGEGFERGATIWVVEWKTGIPIVHTDLDDRIDAAIAAGEK